MDLRFSKYEYSLITDGKKLYVVLPLNLGRNECYIDSDVLPDGKWYFLSNKEEGKYEVKITSTTNNPNIIFELSLKDDNDYDMFTVQCLIEYIINNG